jgi:riboflavin synthase
MFTGLVAGLGEVTNVEPIGDGHDARLTIATPPDFLAGAAIGASIACSGCCLTAITLDADRFTVEVSAETLSLTTLGAWRAGTRLNLERSLRMGDELGGHLVSGHVDGIGTLVSVEPDEGSLRLAFDAPAALAPLIARKGSIAVDGVSLTVNAVTAHGFSVNIIPHTASATTLGALEPGSPVHLEIDMLARYVARLIEMQPAPGHLPGPNPMNSP